MRAGEMTHRILLQRATETQDTFGDPVRTWSEIGQVWAKVDYGSGGETDQGDRQFAEVPVALEVRRSSDTMALREKDRALIPAGATTLRSYINSTTGAMVVNSAGVFPPENEFIVRVDSELMVVSAGSGSTASPYTITRARFGTTAAAHTSDTKVVHMQPVDLIGVTPSRYSMRCAGIRSEVRST